MKNRSVFQLAFTLGLLVCLPGLGSVGLWDPWETHYVEVGRQMLARADLIHPYWEHAWFFSKPPLVPWLSALGLFLSGAQPWGSQGVGPLPHSVEWFVRLPIALLFTFAVAVMASTLEKFTSRRVALLAALILWTMPLTVFLSRQVMTDAPFLACLILALSWALAEKWLPAFAITGVALLAKGLLGFLPFVLVPLAWLVLDGPRGALQRVKALPWFGPLLTLGIGAPWYLAMSLFPERDDEGRRFFERFFGYDHLDRFVSGVHTTTPGGTFTYFIEQGAFAIAPWVVFVPLALFTVTPKDSPARGAQVLFGLTSLVTFVLFTASATRFHHYVFPVLPGLAVLIALSIDQLLTDGFDHRRAPLLIGAALAALVWKDLWQRPRHLLDLFTYNHDRPYPDAVLTTPFPFKNALALIGVLLVGAVLLTLIRKQREELAHSVLLAAGAFAALLVLQHWPALGRHWTQRDLIDHYLASRRSDREPLAAFLMNWKGETLYTRNEVRQISSRDPRGELTAFALQPGRGFVVVEHARLQMLQSVVPPGQAVTPIDLDSNNKFALVALDD
ncbi:MAG: glycosyltransferase family 39 protein [Archangium sp.]|nr:glycosyltransferase family 39 protein [Archangium sp.]